MGTFLPKDINKCRPLTNLISCVPSSPVQSGLEFQRTVHHEVDTHPRSSCPRGSCEPPRIICEELCTGRRGTKLRQDFTASADTAGEWNVRKGNQRRVLTPCRTGIGPFIRVVSVVTNL